MTKKVAVFIGLAMIVVAAVVFHQATSQTTSLKGDMTYYICPSPTATKDTPIPTSVNGSSPAYQIYYNELIDRPNFVINATIAITKAYEAAEEFCKNVTVVPECNALCKSTGTPSKKVSPSKEVILGAYDLDTTYYKCSMELGGYVDHKIVKCSFKENVKCVTAVQCILKQPPPPPTPPAPTPLPPTPIGGGTPTACVKKYCRNRDNTRCSEFLSTNPTAKCPVGPFYTQGCLKECK
jgi:hypothetical protein